jgi:hypothetical protein
MTLKLRSDGLEWRQIDDEIVVLDIRRAEYLAIDGSAVALWSALHEGTSRSELIGSLVERYGIDGDRAGIDVDAFLGDLARRGLLDETPEPLAT